MAAELLEGSQLVSSLGSGHVSGGEGSRARGEVPPCPIRITHRGSDNEHDRDCHRPRALRGASWVSGFVRNADTPRMRGRAPARRDIHFRKRACYSPAALEPDRALSAGCIFDACIHSSRSTSDGPPRILYFFGPIQCVSSSLQRLDAPRHASLPWNSCGSSPVSARF